MTSTTIQKLTSRLALGRDANIGDLYDVRNDLLLKTSVLNQKHSPKITVEDFDVADSCNLQYVFDQSMHELFNFLQIHSEQQASILAHMQVAKGAGSVLHHKNKPNSFNALLKFSLRNRKEEINPADKKLEASIKFNAYTILSAGATHVVCGLIYGADTVVAYSTSCANKLEREQTERSLSNIFDEFKDSMEKGDATNYIENEMPDIGGLSPYVFTDVDVDAVGEFDRILNLKQSLEHIKKISEQLQENYSSARPVVLVLLPLKYFPDVNCAMSSNIPKESLNIMFNFENQVQTMSNFFDLVSKHGSLVMSDNALKEINTFVSGLLVDTKKKRSQFNIWLSEYRNGGKDTFSFTDSEFTEKRMIDLQVKYSNECKELIWHFELSKKDITFLKNERKLKEIILNFNQVYVFNYYAQFKRDNKDEFQAKFKYFLKVVKEVQDRSKNITKKPMEDDISSFTTISSEFLVSFAIFEKREKECNNLDSFFFDEPEEDLHDNENTNSCFIERYQNGELIGFCKPDSETSDLVEDNHSFPESYSDDATVPFESVETESSHSENIPSTCRWDIKFDQSLPQTKPINSAIVTIVCPAFLLPGKCKGSEPQQWLCEECNDILEFDFNGNFFCSCGSGSVTSCSFRCNHKHHKGGFYFFDRSECLRKLQSLKPREELNILVLGETGVGKSTFINAFANYLSFETLDQAENASLISLIATTFTVTNQQYEEQNIQFGHDANENEETGASKTQSCKAYSFPSENRVVRIIDTPGIGDTRGIQQDAKNFENILGFISHYNNIHGILMLLKPNNSRLSAFFRFCIQELLCHLHKSASENIVFVFTNSRSTFYRPGDTLPPLKKLLKEIRDKEPFVEIPLNQQRIYCLDNEAFRFLIALKNSVIFEDDFRSNFASSWTRSVLECERLIKHVLQLKPHSVRETISLNEARRLIVALSKPLGDITQNIQLNIVMVQEQKDKIKRAGDDIEELKKNLLIPVVDLEPMEFDYPRTVCAAPQCYDLHTIDGIQKIDYKQICHYHCYLENVTPELINNPALKNCWAMAHSDNCRICGCHYEKHMHIYYENKQVKRDKIDSTVQEEINSKEKRKESVQKVIDDLEKRSNQLKLEQKIIMKSSAKFAGFLKDNAITPYNDALKDYLEYLISVEEQKTVHDPERKALVEELTAMKQSYEAEVKVLEDSLSYASANGHTEVLRSISISDIKDTVSELYNLEINGNTIKQMVEVFERARANEHCSYSEQVYQPPKRHLKSNYSRGSGMLNRACNALQKMWN